MTGGDEGQESSKWRRLKKRLLGDYFLKSDTLNSDAPAHDACNIPYFFKIIYFENSYFYFFIIYII